MRYLKITSDKNPDNDFIELNDFNGFLCTRFQTLGISRKLEFLPINNRQFAADNKIDFKKYSLTIEILTKYSEYEAKYRELITFLDRNKKSGFRLYYRPYDSMELRYCLCDIESFEKTQKLQPVLLTLVQNSLWLGDTQRATTSQIEQEGNLFVFDEDEDISDYYAASFSLDDNILNYYCVSFYNGAETRATIINNSYNEIPLNVIIYGACVNPTVSLFKKGEETAIKELQVLAVVNEGYHIEINANILGNGVWLVNSATGQKTDYSELVNNELGSPYFYIDNGEYYIKIVDENQNVCYCDIFWQEEYSG